MKTPQIRPSDRSLYHPASGGMLESEDDELVVREVRRRGPVGFVFKWLFVIFNLLMLLWLIAAIGVVGDGTQTAGYSNAELAGHYAGATLGVGILIFLWVSGAIILGLFTLFTRGRMTFVQERRAKRRR